MNRGSIQPISNLFDETNNVFNTYTNKFVTLFPAELKRLGVGRRLSKVNETDEASAVRRAEYKKRFKQSVEQLIQQIMKLRRKYTVAADVRRPTSQAILEPTHDVNHQSILQTVNQANHEACLEATRQALKQASLQADHQEHHKVNHDAIIQRIHQANTQANYLAIHQSYYLAYNQANQQNSGGDGHNHVLNKRKN